MPETTQLAPRAELDSRFSSPDATPTSWDEARQELAQARTYWFTSLRDDGSPHLTTVAALWWDDAVYVTTSDVEQKAKNLERDARCAIVTGCNEMEGLDVVVEARAVQETDPVRLQALANAYRVKYADQFPYEVRDGRMYMEDAPGEVLVYRLQATKAFGFGKGKTFSQTRWRFD